MYSWRNSSCFSSHDSHDHLARTASQWSRSGSEFSLIGVLRSFMDWPSLSDPLLAGPQSVGGIPWPVDLPICHKASYGNLTMLSGEVKPLLRVCRPFDDRSRKSNSSNPSGMTSSRYWCLTRKVSLNLHLSNRMASDFEQPTEITRSRFESTEWIEFSCRYLFRFLL